MKSKVNKMSKHGYKPVMRINYDAAMIITNFYAASMATYQIIGTAGHNYFLKAASMKTNRLPHVKPRNNAYSNTRPYFQSCSVDRPI